MGKKEFMMTGSMTLNTIVRTTIARHCIFRWFIPQYTLLEPGRLYCQAFTASNFIYNYKLIKAGQKLHIAFQCKYSNAQGKFYLTDGDHVICTTEAKEMLAGFYYGSFSETVLLNNNGIYPTEGQKNIAIAFKFLREVSTSLKYNPTSKNGLQKDLDDLCQEIKVGFLDSINPDFTFIFDDVCLKAHKIVLYARSKFFEEFFTKHESITEFTLQEITPGIMYEVLLYMYSGELSELKIELMVKVLEAAILFKIPSLKSKCLNYIKKTNSFHILETMNFYECEI